MTMSWRADIGTILQYCCLLTLFYRIILYMYCTDVSALINNFTSSMISIAYEKTHIHPHDRHDTMHESSILHLRHSEGLVSLHYITTCETAFIAFPQVPWPLSLAVEPLVLASRSRQSDGSRFHTKTPHTRNRGLAEHPCQGFKAA